LISIDQSPRKLMQGILSPPRRRAMQALRLTLVAAPLGEGDFRLDVAVEASRLQFLPIARRH
jgi:hypothetical protein